MRSTQAMRNLAIWLLSHEAAAVKPSEDHIQVVFGVCDKLRGMLSALLGVSGFQSLMARALAHAQAKGHWLNVRLKENGALELTGTAQPDQEEVLQPAIALVSQLLELLITFIGEAFSLRLVRAVWPEAPADCRNIQQEPVTSTAPGGHYPRYDNGGIPGSSGEHGADSDLTGQPSGPVRPADMKGADNGVTDYQAPRRPGRDLKAKRAKERPSILPFQTAGSR